MNEDVHATGCSDGILGKHNESLTSWYDHTYIYLRCDQLLTIQEKAFKDVRYQSERLRGFLNLAFGWLHSAFGIHNLTTDPEGKGISLQRKSLIG